MMDSKAMESIGSPSEDLLELSIYKHILKQNIILIIKKLNIIITESR